MVSIAHIVNPVDAPPSSDLHVAQPITLASLTAAKEFAAQKVPVDLVTCQFEEDRHTIPTDGFIISPDLTRSILDYVSSQIVIDGRKLPLLTDLFHRGTQFSDADYFVYSNIDIAVLPNFYTSVSKMIEEGSEALVINRRTIPDTSYSVTDLPVLYAQIGLPHPGKDCFVFHRSLIERLDLGNVALGAEYVGSVLHWNLALLAGKCDWHKELHLTFHLGNDQRWKSSSSRVYNEFNRREATAVVARLSASHGSLWKNTRTRHLMPDPKRLYGKRSDDRLSYSIMRRFLWR